MPSADEPPLSVRDFRVAAVARALEGDELLLGGLVGAKSLRPPAPNLLAALTTAHERSSGQGFGPFEGVLPQGDTAALLAKRYGAEHIWSVSALDLYQQCPYKFFLGRVLKLDPLKDRIVSTDPMSRGSRAHETLAEMHARIVGRAPADCSPCSGGPQRLAGEYRAAIEGLRQTLCSEQSLEAALTELDLRAVERWLANYFEQFQQYEDETRQRLGEPLVPTYFEVAFGEDARRGAEPNSAVPADGARGLSRSEPFELNVGGEVVRFSGRIDRIDMGQIDGRTLFSIVDYKSGNSTSPHTADPSPLQLALYTLVVRDMLLKDQQALPWAAAYWFLKDKGYQAKLHFGTRDVAFEPTALAEQLESELALRVKAFLEPLRRGEFPMFNVDPKCTSRCEFHTVCRVGQTRALGKEWPAVQSTAAKPQADEPEPPKKGGPRTRASKGDTAKLKVFGSALPQPHEVPPKKRRRSRQP